MNKSSSDHHVYAAPLSRVFDSNTRQWVQRFSHRFWITSIVCAVALPFMAMEIFGSTLPTPLVVMLVFFCWLLPVAFVLWPDLKQPSGLARLTYGRLALVSLGLLACSAGLSLVLLLLLSLAYELITSF